jgi:hypothetical protein
LALDEWDRRRGREGRRWRELVKRLCPPGSLCEVEWCDKATREIAFGLRRNHPMGPSLDHIVPLEEGGHPTAEENLRPAHFGCNAARGNRSRARRARPRRSRAVLPVDRR